MEHEKKIGPLYYVIKEDIKRRIHEGEFKAGEVLPTEHQLCEEYKASRVTIRRAINELISEDILDRGFGKTAMVKFEHVPRNMNRLSSLHEELEQAGIKCSSFILSSEVMDVPTDIKDKMGLNDQNKIWKIERLRYANGQPLCYQVLYLNHKLCEDLDTKVLASVSLYDTLENELGVKVDTATQTIQAVMTTYRIAALLELPEQTCMLHTKRTAYTEEGECIEYSENYYVSSRYTLTMTLKK